MRLTKNNNKKTAYIHIIGVCGVTMAPLAVLYKNMGWKVTSSDRAFFPPMSTYLEENGIKIMPGFKAEHLKENPDFVLVMAFITGKNPEIVEAKKRNIPIKVYADVLPGLIEKGNSIVIAGDCGKTSTTAAVVWLLESAGFNPNFMIGGIPKNFEHGIRSAESDWSVMEGDEYPASSWDKTPRFLYYNPKYLILTDVRWDHMDKYETEGEYIDIFRKFAKKVPVDGFIVANKNGDNIYKVIDGVKSEVIFYSEEDAGGFKLPFDGKIWNENFGAAIRLAKRIGVPDDEIQKGLDSFLGIKRRQDVRFTGNNAVVIDDNAHTPVKVAGGLEALSQMFPLYKFVVVYEPGNRSAVSLEDIGYRDCFLRADTVIFPKVSSASNEIQEFNKKLVEKIGRFYKNLRYIDSDEAVILEIKKMADNTVRENKKLAVVFMSQKGFRGMIEDVISELRI